jgi:Cu/Ag efflux protein CusF
MKTALPLAALLAAALAFPVCAMEQSAMEKTGMSHGKAETGARGTGVINSVDAEQGVVNITHGPIPALSWPEMTMDLSVTDGVDLAGISDGDAVRFRVQLGADQVYRMTAVEAVE